MAGNGWERRKAEAFRRVSNQNFSVVQKYSFRNFREHALRRFAPVFFVTSACNMYKESAHKCTRYHYHFNPVHPRFAKYGPPRLFASYTSSKRITFVATSAFSWTSRHGILSDISMFGVGNVTPQILKAAFLPPPV